MSLIILYCVVCYLFAVIAAYNTKHMPWSMLIIAPCSVPMTIAFIYCKALDDTFG